MNEIKLNHKIFSLEALISSPQKIDRHDLSAYEVEVLQFCQQWLAGQEKFTLTTSGSTSQPKSITLQREQMTASARSTGQALGLQAGDKALVCLSVKYIAGMMMVVRGFELGLALTIVDPSRKPLDQFPTDTHFDFSAFVPMQLQQVLAESPAKLAILNGMKAILIGGAPISQTLQQQLQAISAPIYHTYGMTETVTHIALKRLNGPQANDYFTPLPDVEVGLDSRGCLTITAPVTQGQTIYTNDLAELSPTGSFKWLGRIDNVINSGGIKVQIEKVELALENVLRTFGKGDFTPRRFIVGPIADSQLGQTVAAIIEGPSFSPEAETKIRAELRKILAKYEIPRQFYFTPTLLETPTGKIDRIASFKQIAANNT